MSYMFCKCISLKELKAPKFNAVKVIEMNNMFDDFPDGLKNKIIFENLNI